MLNMRIELYLSSLEPFIKQSRNEIGRGIEKGRAFSDPMLIFQSTWYIARMSLSTERDKRPTAIRISGERSTSMLCYAIHHTAIIVKFNTDLEFRSILLLLSSNI